MEPNWQPVTQSAVLAIDVENEGFARFDGVSSSYYVGQTFVATHETAEYLTVYLGWRPIDARVLITEVEFGDRVFPTTVLFESDTITTPDTQVPALAPYTFALDGLELVAGQTYAIIIDAFVESETNDPVDRAGVGLANIFGPDTYPEGTFISSSLGPFPEGTREEHFSDGFMETSFRDMAFRIIFSAPEPSVGSNPLYVDQWHLKNIGQNGATPGIDLNVETAWQDYSGAGVEIGIWDDGIEYTHPDIAGRYDADLHVSIDGILHDPFPEGPESRHGTAVAGTIAADLNTVGGVGVAFGATIAGVDIFYDPAVDVPGSMAMLGAFDVTNHSWGWINPFADSLFSASPAAEAFYSGLEDSTVSGRGGLGTINVVASGSERQLNRDANDSNLVNIPQTIAVAAVDDTGSVGFYSNPGASVLVSGLGNGSVNGVTTTDRTGTNGYGPGDYTDLFGGTSAAAAMVSGVVALMLEANPDLGWRDVQDILAYSARHVGTPIGSGPSGDERYSWAYNGAENWNGGGLHFSNDYGFGLVDATAAVRLAESWQEQDTDANWIITNAAQIETDIAIPDNDVNGITVTLDASETLDIEHVGLSLVISDGFMGDYVIELTSPDGTVSALSTPFNDGDPATEGWFLSSNAFRGEAGPGTWTLHIGDIWEGAQGTLRSATLTFFGNAPGEDDTYVYTNAFSEVYDGSGHIARIDDDAGSNDTLNATAVSSASSINLLDGTATIDGVVFDSIAGIERVFTGDGDDLLVGGTGNDVLGGFRGNDTINGRAGSDTIEGGAGDDIINGGIGAEMVSGGEGNDTIIGADGFDTINGDAGNDTLNGNAGDDTISGGDGDDLIDGGIGADVLNGDAGNDTITALEGFDTISGGAGNDTIEGNAGNDTIDGGLGADDIRGGQGIDVITGGEGDDVIRGEIGPDLLSGGTGNDTVAGGEGDDRIAGDTGDDVLTGFIGADTFVFDSGTDTITDFGSVDRIALDALALGIVGLTASQVITRFRSSDGTDSMFDFGDGNILIVEDRPAGAFFQDRIDII